MLVQVTAFETCTGTDNEWSEAAALPVSHIACGTEHVLAVAGGRVFGWGCPEYGRLGLGEDEEAFDDEGVFLPRELPALHDSADAVQVCAAASSSAAVTGHGEVLVWGSNDEGQLGLGVAPGHADHEEQVWEPVKLGGIKHKVRRVGRAAGHRMWMCGRLGPVLACVDGVAVHRLCKSPLVSNTAWRA